MPIAKFAEASLLFNIAQCYRQLDDKPQAIRFYRTFLREIPRAPNRDDVLAIVQNLEAALAEATKAGPPQGTISPAPVTASPPVVASADAPSPAVVESAPAASSVVPVATSADGVANGRADRRAGRTKMIAGLTVAALGVAGVGVGVAFGVLAHNEASALSKIAQDHGEFDPGEESAGRRDQTLQGVLLGVGAVAVATGVVVAALGYRQARATRRVHVAGIVSRALSGASLEVGF